MTAKEEMLLYEHIDWARRAMKKQMPLPIRKEARLEFCSMCYFSLGNRDKGWQFCPHCGQKFEEE